MEITLETLPTWLVGLVMLYTGFIWLITREDTVRMDSRIIAYTLLVWGTLYILTLLAGDNSEHTMREMILRVFLSRVVILLLCISQSLPLSISYFRRLKEK